ncbi:MAG: hypothetical protein E3J60_04220 [Dehalococcoidia bacterium]|nr:MAG: hypothetical protein E3J60_04220 [Dehalococcoidia bacterium]
MESNKSNVAPAYRKTLFLDSNYIIYLSLFFKLCATVGHKPADSSILSNETLAKCGVSKSKLEIDRLKDGKKLFDYLTGEVRQGSEIVTSRFCELEFLHLLLERQAHENLLNAGVPFRLRSKRYGFLYLTSLEPNDYVKAAGEYQQLKDTLGEYSIEMKILEEVVDYEKQIIETTKIVIGSIMMEAPDAFVYAAAVVAEADELLTTDGTLKSIANKLRNPSEEGWKSIAGSFRQRLEEQSISTGEASDRVPFTLPEAKKL